jgi:hypothetical protein
MRIDELTGVCQGRFTLRITEVTKNVFEIGLLGSVFSLITIIRRHLAIIPHHLVLVICLFRRLIEDIIRTFPDTEDFSNDTSTYVFA